MVNTYTFHCPSVRVCSSLPVSFSLCCLPVGIWMWPWVDNHCLLSQSMVTALRSAAFLFLWVFPYFFCPRSFLVLCPPGWARLFCTVWWWFPTAIPWTSGFQACCPSLLSVFHLVKIKQEGCLRKTKMNASGNAGNLSQGFWSHCLCMVMQCDSTNCRNQSFPYRALKTKINWNCTDL